MFLFNFYSTLTVNVNVFAVCLITYTLHFRYPRFMKTL